MQPTSLTTQNAPISSVIASDYVDRSVVVEVNDLLAGNPLRNLSCRSDSLVIQEGSRWYERSEYHRVRSP
ncbi:hypothetical protein [Rosistilla ulvae]|uniref:hypothetical protein n=1 Tax=Rosistilla ulvae TaxID=1930277 RepID=UPI0011A84C99|nr:hypothetical protein [Rosistilla ulvae]